MSNKITSIINVETSVVDLHTDYANEIELAKMLKNVVNDFLTEFTKEKTLDEKWQYEIDVRIGNENVDGEWESGKDWEWRR